MRFLKFVAHIAHYRIGFLNLSVGTPIEVQKILYSTENNAERLNGSFDNFLTHAEN